jgi:hypothetical protein
MCSCAIQHSSSNSNTAAATIQQQIFIIIIFGAQEKQNKTASLVWSVGVSYPTQQTNKDTTRDETRRDDIYTTQQQPRATTIGYYRTEHIRMPPHPSMPFL